jgi:hypothetical protein
MDARPHRRLPAQALAAWACLRCALRAALCAAVGLGFAPAGQADSGAAEGRQAAAFSPATQAVSRGADLPGQLATLREERVRAALERSVPAPRVQALVSEMLPGDVQVVVVRNAPGGVGAYYPGLMAIGYEHVYTNTRQRRVHSGRPGLIVLDARLEEQADRDIIAFVLAHEHGHHRLERGHGELHADAYARDLLTRLGMWSPGIAAQAFQFAAGVPLARWLVPAVADRLRALEAGPQAVAMAQPR